MITIINNGIVSNGNNNNNTINSNITNFENIKFELEILEKNCNEDLSELKHASDEKNYSKLIMGLKKLKKETIELIKVIGLKTIEKIIDKIL